MLPALYKGVMEKNRTTVNHKTSLKNTHRCQKPPPQNSTDGILKINSCNAISYPINEGLKLSVAQRKFLIEVAALVDKTVSISTTTGKTFTGTLIGINPDNLSLCISEAKDETGQVAHRVFLNGNTVTQIITAERPFDLKSLAGRLEKVFPTMVKLYEDKGFIWVMDKVKLTERGVVEGSGPAAERVQRVYEQFMSETKT
jgi:small nuclear ribonucleoprotein (snRNP)-like protein